MDLHSWERYDVDEYFIKYANISPVLTYAETDLDREKLNLQTNLLKKYLDNNMTKNQLVYVYKSYIDFSTKEDNNLIDIKKTLDNVYKIRQEECKKEKIKKIKDIILSLD